MDEAQQYVEHGNMVRNELDDWGDHPVIGEFDISQHPLEGYPAASGHIIFRCPNERTCVVLIGPAATPPGDGQRLHIWAWDGNVERPTLTPSINCLAEKDGKPTSGCGWHGFITAGVIR